MEIMTRRGVRRFAVSLGFEGFEKIPVVSFFLLAG